MLPQMSFVLTFDFLQIRIQTAKNELFSCGEDGRQCVSEQFTNAIIQLLWKLFVEFFSCFHNFFVCIIVPIML